MSEPATFRQMTAEERRVAVLLGLCRFAPATFDKRFARDLRARAQEPEPRITEKQAAVLKKLAHRYRKQLSGLASRPEVMRNV